MRGDPQAQPWLLCVSGSLERETAAPWCPGLPLEMLTMLRNFSMES